MNISGREQIIESIMKYLNLLELRDLKFIHRIVKKRAGQ